MINSGEFLPNWASPPGDTINDILCERGIRHSEFAASLEESEGFVQDLLEGRSAITIGLARRLQNILGASAEFWIARDAFYREDSSRLNQSESEWLCALPVSDMIKFRWLSPTPLPTDEFQACLGFFEVSSISEWEIKYSAVEQYVSFRTSRTFESRPAAVAAWLQRGEIEATSMGCNQWNQEAFRGSLHVIRSLSKIKSPDIFLPKLQKICAASGVAVVIIRAPNGCRASGAARFVTKELAAIQLSFRHLSDDHFWFSFFHEAGHLILHGGELFLEGLGISSLAEDEANNFAANVLVPSEHQLDLKRLRAGRDIIQFAVNIGVSPGIVVGQLQHLGILRHNEQNRLKRRFQWE